MIKAAALIPKVTTALVLTALWFSVGATSCAKPMLSPTAEEAICEPLIVEAEFMRIIGGGKEYFQPPIVQYRVKRVWRNSTGDKTAKGASLALVYEFQDGSACMEPTGWKFSSSLMPKPGASQILFLHPNPTNRQAPYATYRGDSGRWEATPKQIARLQALLKTVEKSAE